MSIRTVRERVLQTACFELIGIAIVSPLYALAVGASVGHGVALIAVISVVVLVWSPLHNTAFDLIDWHWSGRTACQRPHGVRVFHAFSHETSAVLLTCPLIIWIGGHSLVEALALNLGLTVTYTAYAYLFHLVYDRLRPVRAGMGMGTSAPSTKGKSLA